MAGPGQQPGGGQDVPPRGPPPRRRPPSRDMTGDMTLPLARRRGDEIDGGRGGGGGPGGPSRQSNKDCFIIPQGNLERFLPDGITVTAHQNKRICKNMFYVLKKLNSHRKAKNHMIDTI